MLMKSKSVNLFDNEINHFALINVYEQLLALKQSKQCEPFVDAFYTPI